MTIKELITICKPLKILGSEPESLGSLIQDSRHVSMGDVFIAVRGTQSDGHDYIDMAISKGAAVIITEEEQPPSSIKDIYQLVVKNTRSLLSPLALAFNGNPQKDITVVGVTGTNGKTTVSTLTYQILMKIGYKTALLGTVEKRIGNKRLPSKLTTPGALEIAQNLRAMVDAGCTHAIMEVSSHALDQDRASGIPFKVAAFTNLSHDHLDYHKTIKAYAKAKKKLFDQLRPDDYAIINDDDEYGSFMSKDSAASIWKCSFTNNADYPCKIISNTAKHLIIDIEGTRVQSPLTGEFNAYNIAEAYLICLALGCSKSNIVSALSSAQGAPGRLEKITIANDSSLPVIFVDYAHTPDALEKVSDTLAKIKKDDQKLHIIFGCGGNRDVTKRPLMAAIAEKYGDQVIVTSDNPRFEDPEKIIDDAVKGLSKADNAIRESDREKAIQWTIAHADPNDIILIAGKGHEDYQEINGERHHFDDREIAQNALYKRKSDLKADKEVS